MEYSEDDMLMLSGIQHFAFCKRQWALAYIYQMWSDNSLTLEGSYLHRNADNPLKNRRRGDIAELHALPVASKSLGLYGVCDVVELSPSSDGVAVGDFDGLWNIRPVEYKRGVEKIDICDEVQLCAQAICLEELFNTKIPSGDIFYGKRARRSEVVFSDELRKSAYDLSAQMHEVFRADKAVSAEYSKKCRSCSLIDICIPKAEKRINSVSKYLEKLKEQ